MTVEIQPHFLSEVCEYIASNLPGQFTFGMGNSNLKIGEIIRGTNGVYATDAPSPPPDSYTATDYVHIDFTSLDSSSKLAWDRARYIYELFHQNHHWQTQSYYVYYSRADAQIQDMDRTAEGQKMYRATILFTSRRLIS